MSRDVLTNFCNVSKLSLPEVLLSPAEHNAKSVARQNESVCALFDKVVTYMQYSESY